jgi:DNA-binding NtrC family response regulator
MGHLQEETSMAEQISALLVHGQDEACQALSGILKSLSVEVVHAHNCREASLFFNGQSAIDMVFTGIDLPDGSWADVLGLAQKSKCYLPVIAVSQTVDIELYLGTLGEGAFDFIAPPFLTSDLAHIIRSAIYKELLSAKQDLNAPPQA